MKKCMNGKVYLLQFIILFTHYPIIINGYKLIDDKSNWRLSEHDYNENFGTVLFDNSDVAKVCWSNDELILLNSRIIFNDILPQVDMIDGKNDKYIDMLMEYINICVNMVEKLTEGKIKNLIMKALADTIGGYFQVYIIPLTKSSYYAGNIKYQKAKCIFDLYDDLKFFLRTNGVGWFKPIISTYYFEVTPIFISYNRSRRARTSCSNLILYSENGNGDSDNDENDDDDLVPIPFLDDDKRPNSIALPYENKSLHSLFDEKSAFILVKYYIDSINCILLTSMNENKLIKFKQKFNNWLKRVVKPLLNNDNWYPAFGGVLRVIASIENVEFNSQLYNDTDNQQFHVLPEYNVQSEFKSESSWNKFINPKFDLIEIAIIIISIIVLIYLSIGLCINWCIIRSRDRRKIDAFKKTPLFEFYKKPKRTRYTKSFRSSRYQIETIKCPCSDDDTDDDDDDDEDEEKCLRELTYNNDTSEIISRKNELSQCPSIQATPRRSSIGVHYTSDETSAFSSPEAKENRHSKFNM